MGYECMLVLESGLPFGLKPGGGEVELEFGFGFGLGLGL
jgi:hypothetical protein